MIWGLLILPLGIVLCLASAIVLISSDSIETLGIGISLAFSGAVLILRAAIGLQRDLKERKTHRQQAEMVSELRAMKRTQDTNPNQLEVTNRALGQALKMLKETGKSDDELRSMIRIYQQNRRG